MSFSVHYNGFLPTNVQSPSAVSTGKGTRYLLMTAPLSPSAQTVQKYIGISRNQPFFIEEDELITYEFSGDFTNRKVLLKDDFLRSNRITAYFDISDEWGVFASEGGVLVEFKKGSDSKDNYFYSFDKQFHCTHIGCYGNCYLLVGESGDIFLFKSDHVVNGSFNVKRVYQNNVPKDSVSHFQCDQDGYVIVGSKLGFLKIFKFESENLTCLLDQRVFYEAITCSSRIWDQRAILIGGSKGTCCLISLNKLSQRLTPKLIPEWQITPTQDEIAQIFAHGRTLFITTKSNVFYWAVENTDSLSTVFKTKCFKPRAPNTNLSNDLQHLFVFEEEIPSIQSNSYARFSLGPFSDQILPKIETVAFQFLQLQPSYNDPHLIVGSRIQNLDEIPASFPLALHGNAKELFAIQSTSLKMRKIQIFSELLLTYEIDVHTKKLCRTTFSVWRRLSDSLNFERRADLDYSFPFVLKHFQLLPNNELAVLYFNAGRDVFQIWSSPEKKAKVSMSLNPALKCFEKLVSFHLRENTLYFFFEKGVKIVDLVTKTTPQYWYLKSNSTFKSFFVDNQTIYFGTSSGTILRWKEHGRFILESNPIVQDLQPTAITHLLVKDNLIFMAKSSNDSVSLETRPLDSLSFSPKPYNIFTISDFSQYLTNQPNPITTTSNNNNAERARLSIDSLLLKREADETEDLPAKRPHQESPSSQN